MKRAVLYIRFGNRLLTLAIFFSVFFAGGLEAQQKVQYTQYMFNGLILNPAYAGMDDALSVTFYNRNQWQSVEGAPTTQTLSGHSLFKHDHLGIGLSVINDKIGIHKNLSASGSAAYHLKIATHSLLSMGIQAGFNHKRSDYASIVGNTGYDPRLFNSPVSQTFLDLGVGFYFRSPRLHVGFSAPEITPGKLFINDTLSVRFSNINYFLFSKYRFILNENLDLEPSILLKYLESIPLSFDVNANVIIYKVLTLGLSYRKQESVDFLFKAQITPQLQLGYAYDHALGSVSNMTSASHEFMVNYLFKFSESRIASPR
jgi:type IX secretion system PorP/SprF family membrane protein